MRFGGATVASAATPARNGGDFADEDTETHALESLSEPLFPSLSVGDEVDVN